VSRRGRGLIGLLAGAIVAGAVVGACFSERSATGPVEGTCRLPVNEGVPGSVLVPISEFAFLPSELHVHAG
jgi:hypothetical protein